MDDLSNKVKLNKVLFNKQPLKTINIMHQNIQHLGSRIDNLASTLHELKPDLLVLTEHKMTEPEIICLDINTMIVKSFYARHTTSGGGVLIMSKPGLSVKRLTLPAITQITVDKEFECCIVQVKCGGFSFILVGLYRTPKHCFITPFLNKLDVLISVLNKVNKNIIIAGDVNIDVLKQSHEKIKLENVLSSHQMILTIDFPTRVSSSGGSAIDNIFTNLPKSNIQVSGIITELSDHDAQLLQVYMILRLKKPKTQVKVL